MKKIGLFALLLSITTLSIFSSPYTISYDGLDILEASDNELGLIQSDVMSPLMIEMSKSLGEEYNSNWLENYVSPTQRNGFSKSYSKTLLSILPMTEKYYFISPNMGEVEDELVIRMESGEYLSFIYESKNKTLIALKYSESL